MSSSSLPSIFDLTIPDMAIAAWGEVLRRAWARSREITDQRFNIPEINEDWQRLHNFEYQHFYSSWVAVAFRFQSCADHDQDFTEAFQRSNGASQEVGLLYQEDDALFGFFVKGLSALESFYYSLYALGALIYTPPEAPSVPPPNQFRLLDPKNSINLRSIKPINVQRAFEKEFSEQPLTAFLRQMLNDEKYKEWSHFRNILAHRVAVVGRTVQYPGFSFSGHPMSVSTWGTDLLLDARTTASRYEWLKETVNRGLEETAAFTIQRLAYTEDQLHQLAW